jgi:hypothetical protein
VPSFVYTLMKEKEVFIVVAGIFFASPPPPPPPRGPAYMIIEYPV